MLFRFQWHIDKLALGGSLGPEFISTSPLNKTRGLAARKKCLAKNPFEKETRQISWTFCDRYVSIPEIEK